MLVQVYCFITVHKIECSRLYFRLCECGGQSNFFFSSKIMYVSDLDSSPGCVRVEGSPTFFSSIQSMNVSALDYNPGCVRVEVCPTCCFHFTI